MTASEGYRVSEVTQGPRVAKATRAGRATWDSGDCPVAMGSQELRAGRGLQVRFAWFYPVVIGVKQCFLVK